MTETSPLGTASRLQAKAYPFIRKRKLDIRAKQGIAFQVWK
jgi:hypothetical protein